jgi:hypothetical protein
MEMRMPGEPVTTGKNSTILDNEAIGLEVIPEFPDLSAVLDPIDLFNTVTQNYYCFTPQIAKHFPDKFVSVINSAKATIESDFELPVDNKTIEQKWYFAVAMAIYIKKLRFVYPQFSDLFDGFTEKFISPKVYYKYNVVEPLADFEYEFYRVWHELYAAPVVKDMVPPSVQSSKEPKVTKNIALKVANAALAAILAAGAVQMYLDAPVEHSPEVAPGRPDELMQANPVSITSTLPQQEEPQELGVMAVSVQPESTTPVTQSVAPEEAESVTISQSLESAVQILKDQNIQEFSYEVILDQLMPVSVQGPVDISSIGEIPGQNEMYITHRFTENGINYTYYEPRSGIDFNGLNASVSTLNDPLVQRQLAGQERPELARFGAIAQNSEVVLTDSFTYIEYTVDDTTTLMPYIQTENSTFVALTYLTYEPQATAEVNDIDTEDSLETKYAYLLNEEVEYTSKAGNTKSYICSAIDGESVTLSAKNNPGFKFQVNLATLEAREGCIKLADSHSEVCDANEVDIVAADTNNRCDMVVTA